MLDRVNALLLEFGFRNFFSFREGATISFRLGANAPAEYSFEQPVATVLGVKGANASGKTQVLKALAFVASFAVKSFSADPEDELLFTPYYGSTEPSDFYVEFETGGVEYRYELSCTEKEVLRETVFQKKAKRVKVFERFGTATPLTTKSFEKLKQIKLRGNASAISSAHQYEFPQLEPVYSFFKKIGGNVSGFSGLIEMPSDISKISGFLKQHESLLNFVNELLPAFDTGITRVAIRTRTNEDGKEEHYPMFIHGAGEKEVQITHHLESSGTKALFRALPLYHIVLQNGGVLILDEFDIHLHPHLVPKLLDLFMSKPTNPGNGQLLFTTHDTAVLDLLGKYRVYLVNKVDNESFAYRLDEIGGEILRNDRSIAARYVEGKIGGVPRV